MTPASQRKEPGDPRAKVIEVMARGVRERYVTRSPLTLLPWDALTEPTRESYRRDAEAALAALEAEGWGPTSTREAERLRFVDRAFAKVPQDLQARAMQAVEAEEPDDAVTGVRRDKCN